MNRLLAVTKEAQRFNEKLFCAFLTLGYPSVKKTEALIEEFDLAGVDIVELGFPFSDPMADGPTIQFSSDEALKKGVQIEDAFRTAKNLRRKNVGVPLIFFSYFNPIFHYGMKPFLKKAQDSGFDGVIIPDLPPDSEEDFHKEVSKQGLASVYLITPTTGLKRSALIAKKSQGFIYYVSLRGVTGARRTIAKEVYTHIRTLKKQTKTPILVGFGVSTPAQAKKLSEASQGVIVGSAIINEIKRSKGKISTVVRYVRKMVKSVKGQ